MAIGLIIIGDEILSGKRVDQHLPKAISILKNRGLQLDWVEYIGDDKTRIIATLKRSFSSGDIVFCTGGIGATPDDHTRQCAAAALGVEIELHPEAKTLIQSRILEMSPVEEKHIDPDIVLNTAENLHRLKMGEFPIGASIIPNSFNKIPGFFIKEHYFTPGFPVMAWPMIEWVLDTHYSHLFHKVAHTEKSVLVFETMESTITPMMEELESTFPLIKVFSLPSVGSETIRRHIELGVKGNPEQVQLAFNAMLKGLDGFKAEYIPTEVD